MPGIVGIIGPGIPEDNHGAIRQMVQAMRHEPFYASGTFADEALGIWAGWVSHAGSFSDRMPIWNETKEVGLIFAGEDFTDPWELDGLRARGHSWDPGSAGYLVHLYEELGDRFFERLNGRFSGLLIDLRQRRLVVFNDRYGLNRIYFAEKRGMFYFASEAKALLRILPELRRMDPTGLAEQLTCGCVLQNRTLFSGVSLIPGGSAWRFAPGEKRREDSYFRADLWTNQEPMPRAEYYPALRETWRRILPRYFQGPERVAVSLTGGKDSRMVMAWTEATPGALPCYTFGGIYRDCADVKLARRVARICRQPYQVIPVDKTFLEQFPALAARTVYLTDGVMDVTAAPDLFANRIARDIAPTRLTGNYGQEILCGAVAFKPVALDKGLFESEFATLLGRSAQTYAQELAPHRRLFIAFKQVPWHHYSRLAVELSQLTLRSPFLDNDLVGLTFRVPPELDTDIDLQLKLIAEGNPSLGRLATDRGLRFRAIPVLTRFKHLFQEFTFKAEYAYDYGMPQWLVKLDGKLRAVHLERLFLGRHKFYHFRVWYRDQLASYVKEILLDPRTLTRPYWNGRRIEDIVKNHTAGAGNYTTEIHRLLTSELIQREFLERS